MAVDLGQEMKRRLMKKAAEGVRVYVIYDEIGSSALSRSSMNITF